MERHDVANNRSSKLREQAYKDRWRTEGGHSCRYTPNL